MRTLTLFVLRDESEHKSLKEALNHCDEMMGAELRPFIDKVTHNYSLYKSMLEVVSEKKHDAAIISYVEWRDEKTR